MASRANNEALIALYAYQKAWITDEARFKLCVKGRQEGLSFATTLRHVRRRIAKKGTTIWISASDRQSREAIEYCKIHLLALGEIFDHEELKFPDTEDRAQQITIMRDGAVWARIIAMPANPDTVRGFSGDVVLDEFAFHRDAKKIWKAAMAIASRGYQVEVISTPNGQQGKYFEIAKAAGVPMDGGAQEARWTKGVWSVHWIDIESAVAQGCPVNIAELREAAGDEDTWLQEYNCVFLSDAENYIPMELAITAEHGDAKLDMPIEQLAGRELYLGVDIGRKKDRTVLWLNEKVGDVFWTRRVETLEKTKFRVQFEQIDALMPYVRRACVDSTGIGAQIGEELVEKYGGRVEAVEFNIANKEAMATASKTHFEDRTLRIPSSPVLRRSINAVKRYNSPTGHFRFDAERTEAGHADEFWALALSLSAGASSAPAVMKSSPAKIGARENVTRGVKSIDEFTKHERPKDFVQRDRRSLWRR
jgi:phage FluMu gp28-like protein